MYYKAKDFLCPDDKKCKGDGQVNESFTVAGIVMRPNDERGIGWHCNCTDI